MPILASLPTTTCTLPASGAVVQLSMSYGDKVAINRAVFGSAAISDDGKTSFTGEVAVDLSRAVCEMALKAWDFTDEQGAPVPVSWDAIGRLDPKDGDAIEKASMALYNATVDAPKGGKSRTS